MADGRSEGRIPHELILGALGEGVYGVDREGRGTFANDAAVRILGWRGRDIVGQPIHDIHHHSHADGRPYPREECPVYAAVSDGEVHTVDSEVFWHADGSPVPVEYTSTPILEAGEVVGAVVVFRDISERRALELEREDSIREIRALKEQLEHERDYLREELRSEISFDGIIGASEALKRALAQIEAVAATPATVLIQGESGVGKEGIARALHDASPRSDAPLVRVNCASIPADLFESEFFGHVRGAFTGAHADRIGRLQLADGGTLFLDEVSEIPLGQQGKLLRALQEQEFERVGDEHTIRVDVRFVAASNRDLLADVKAGRFREDLYYRLSVFPIEVPPLRERKADIGLLARHFVAAACRELGREELSISRNQVAILEAQAWPGNVRELKNVLERAVILSTQRRLRLDSVLDVSTPPSDALIDDGGADFLTEEEFRSLERGNLVAALNAAEWRISGEAGAARLLGLKPSTVAYRMRKFGISRP